MCAFVGVLLKVTVIVNSSSCLRDVLQELVKILLDNLYICIYIYEISHAVIPILKLVASRIWQNWCRSLRLKCFMHQMDGVLRHTVFSMHSLMCPALLSC